MSGVLGSSGIKVPSGLRARTLTKDSKSAITPPHLTPRKENRQH
jgi:hypothetical protein